MKRFSPVIALSFMFCLLAINGFTQQSLPQKKLRSPLVWETSLGIGNVNHRGTGPSISLRTGYENYMLTARFIRSNNSANYIFENNWLAGYRFNFKKGFNSTLSAGAGDIAFVNKFGKGDQRIIRETVGFAFDAELQWIAYSKDRPSGFGFFANYHTTINSYKNLNGFLVGLTFSPVQIRKGYAADKKMQAFENQDSDIPEEPIDRMQARYERRREREMRRAERTNRFGWEIAPFAGISDRPFAGGVMTQLTYKRILIGANFIISRRKYYTEWIPVAWHHETLYYKDRQHENMVFAGYRVWEKSGFGWNLSGGLSWRKNKIYRCDDPNVFRPYYRPIGSKDRAGFALQSEFVYTFRNHGFGFGLIQFASFYKGYSAAGAAFSLRFGFLR